MEKKNQEIKKDEKGRVIMEWPTPEDRNKEWGRSGYDTHVIK